ncbi:hypothetical protein TWF225_007643 [Orbilia oligospora]|uniref:DUF7587 domain-containing protein n=1 Tax=Orbilia oligospora TaxID=2813651 RepID=A0A7C8P6P5_ORBOL|nr:hypothetical protein TWF751_011375 [Orbilia oligospora]KAF3179109.1 hypothetical protein TWF225_007643 [Orbilia oligospora]KAF3236524.1 hypothetical protein TWF217_002526 [Orbilia oligospora]KAF3240451.1 hypothetical protein TWF128_011283 [Orbilia oligospora]KAF3296936.1 hypothetical protein TWF132_009429 [Orbilia oligospora]
MALFGKNRYSRNTGAGAVAYTPKKSFGQRIKDMVLPKRKRKAVDPIAPTSFRVLRSRPYGTKYTPGFDTSVSTPVAAVVTATPVTVTPAPTPAASAALAASSSSFGDSKKIATEAQKLKQLEETTKNIPRYLFRACSPTSGGGLKGLNTINGVFPHAFVDTNGVRLPNGGNKSIHDIPYQVTRRMAVGHLSGQRPARTDPTYSQFSSWAATLALVLQYGYSRASQGGLICVLDRYNLPKHTKVYHCPDMMKAGLCDSPYDHEYLVHGPVEGPGFKAVTVQSLLDMGLYTEIPCVQPHSARYWWGPIPQRDWESLFPAKEFSQKQVKALRNIANEFGKDFALPVLAALVTLDRRKLDKNGKFGDKDLKIFADVVEDLYIPEEYGTEKSIVQPDGVYVQGYPMVAQLVGLLKQLVEYNYGRGVRARRRIEVEDLSAELGALGLPGKKSLDMGEKAGRLSTSFAFGVSDVPVAVVA